MANSGSVHLLLNNLSFVNSDVPKELKDELNKIALSAGFVVDSFKFQQEPWLLV